MQGKGIGEPCRVDLLRRIKQVRRGLAVEAEGTAAVLFQTDEGKGRVGLIGKGQMGEVDAAGFQFPGDLVAEGVVAQLAAHTLAGAPPVRGLNEGTSSKEQPTLDGIISMSASPMENSVLPDIENLPN